MFPRIQTDSRELNQLQTLIQEAFLPLQNNPMCNGTFLNNIALISGSTTIFHGLGHPVQGWIVTMIDGAATIYDAQSTNPSPKTLVLVSDAAVTVNLYVF